MYNEIDVYIIYVDVFAYIDNEAIMQHFEKMKTHRGQV